MADKVYLDKEGLTHLLDKLKESVSSGGVEVSTIISATATADATHSESPTVTVDVGGEPGAQTLTFTFTGLQGAPGEAGKEGPQGPPGEFTGTSSQILLGDGTPLDISEFITTNIETIRTAIGVATVDHNGLVPQLPASE